MTQNHLKIADLICFTEDSTRSVGRCIIHVVYWFLFCFMADIFVQSVCHMGWATFTGNEAKRKMKHFSETARLELEIRCLRFVTS